MIKLILTSLLIVASISFAQDSSKNEAKVSIFTLYDGLVMRVLSLEDYDSKLPIDGKRPPVLQRYFSSLSLTEEECNKISRAARRANDVLKANHQEALAFIRTAKSDQSRSFEAVKPTLQRFSSRREAALLSFKSELIGFLSPDKFLALDRHLNSQAISRMHTSFPPGPLPLPSSTMPIK